MNRHPDSVIDVYAATIPSFPFKPSFHIHYQETVLRMKDGLPKFKDLPKGLADPASCCRSSPRFLPALRSRGAAR